MKNYDNSAFLFDLFPCCMKPYFYFLRAIMDMQCASIQSFLFLNKVGACLLICIAKGRDQ
jgi:hypothetical protein